MQAVKIKQRIIIIIVLMVINKYVLVNINLYFYNIWNIFNHIYSNSQFYNWTSPIITLAIDYLIIRTRIIKSKLKWYLAYSQEIVDIYKYLIIINIIIVNCYSTNIKLILK